MSKHCMREYPEGEIQCCICCPKGDQCDVRCDDMNLYEYADECPDYVEAEDEN